MKKVLIAGCAQEISSFNRVECKYEIFHIIQGNEIYDYHLGKNSYIGGAIEEINKSKNIGTSDLKAGCIDSTLIKKNSEEEWIIPENVNPRDEEKFNYAVKIEPSLGLDPLCIKNLLFLILNNDLGWSNVAEKSFQLTGVEDSDYVYIFASPEKTDELCAPIETNSIYSVSYTHLRAHET